MFMLCVSSWNSQGRAHVGKHFVQHLKVGDCEKMANDIIRQLVVAPLRHLVLKRNIAKRVSKALVRFMKGHSTTEHLFTVKSMIAYYAMIEQPLITQNIDISKFFDKENLRDAMNTLYEAGVKGKPYRLWYKLNQNTRITVKTDVGVTEERDTGETLGQGTVGGMLASALNIDE